MNIPRILVFDKVTGSIIKITQTSNCGLKIKTDDELLKTFECLRERTPEFIVIYRCEWEEFDAELLNGGIPSYNPSTNEIIWEYTEEQQEQLTELEKVKQELNETKQLLADLIEVTLMGGV